MLFFSEGKREKRRRKGCSKKKKKMFTIFLYIICSTCHNILISWDILL